MRISTQQIFQPGVNAMQEAQAKLSRVQQQLATGQRMLAPSDDPAAAVKVMNLQEAVDTYRQYQRNADAVRGRLEQEEIALASMTDLLQRVRELNVQANNDSNALEDRQAIAAEVREHLDGMVQLLNTRDASGEYIFAGHEVFKPAVVPDGSGGYLYDGDAGQRLVQVGPERQVAMGDPASAFYDNLSAAAGGTTSITDVLGSLASVLEAGTASQDTLTDLSTAIESVSNTRAQIGARLNTVDAQTAANDAAIVALETNRSQLEDLDYAEAVSRLNLQLVALQAAQQSFAKIQGLSLFNYL